MVVIFNKTTGETNIFDTDDVDDCARLNLFCRKAVMDFVCNNDINTMEIGKGKYMTITPENPEPMIWLYCGMLYMKCVEDGDWGPILGIMEVEKEDENEYEDEDTYGEVLYGEDW